MSQETNRPELTPEQRCRVDTLLSDVIERPDHAREAYLRRQCADDADVLQEVMLLLSAYAKETAAKGSSCAQGTAL